MPLTKKFDYPFIAAYKDIGELHNDKSAMIKLMEKDGHKVIAHIINHDTC